MKVVSTNLGTKRAIEWQGKEVFTGIYKFPVDKPLFLGPTDVEQDDVIDRKYHGGADKACYLYGADHYNYWKKQFPNLNWQFGMFGENITVEGLDEGTMRIGDIYKLGNATVQVTQPRQPCYKLGIRLENPLAVKLFVDAELPGAYLRVLEPGTVTRGDKMELMDSNSNRFTLKEIFHFIYHTKDNIEAVKQAIEMPELAESCRKDLIKYGKL